MLIGYIGIVGCSFIIGVCIYQLGKLLALYLHERQVKKPKLRIATGGIVLKSFKH